MTDDYKYEALIPEKFTIGLDDNAVGFPSMKDKDGKWTNVSFFERHSGFKPNSQRDARKEITKVLTQKVQEIENVPTSGFELVDLCKHIYHGTDLYRNTNCVILKDPRGWKVQIALENFKVLLEKSGMNLKDGVIDGVEVMYGWPLRSYGPFSLYVVDDKVNKMKDATCKMFKKREVVEYIKPSQFEVGKIYSSKNSKMGDGSKYDSMYMYLGVHAIYSDDCHFRAVMTRNYDDLEKYVKDRTDITHPERHVFYCLNPKHPVIPHSHGIFNNYPSSAPYYVTATVSKLFDKVEDVDPAKFKLYNDKSKPATFENIKEDMQHSAYFNRIDFAKSNSLVRLDYQFFEDFYGYMHGYDYDTPTSVYMAAFPFYPYTSGIFLNGDIGCSFTITISSYAKEKKEPGKYVVKEPRMYNDYSGGMCRTNRTYKTYEFEHDGEPQRAAFRQLFDDIHPTVKQYVFCNGNKVPEYQNFFLNKRTYYYDLKY